MPAAGSNARTLPPQQNWEFLFRQTLLFAHYQVRCLYWRGDDDGLLPDGYDANSLAAQAFLEFLLDGSSDGATVHPSPRGRGTG